MQSCGCTYYFHDSSSLEKDQPSYCFPLLLSHIDNSRPELTEKQKKKDSAFWFWAAAQMIVEIFWTQSGLSLSPGLLFALLNDAHALFTVTSSHILTTKILSFPFPLFPLQAKCISSNALRRWIMRRPWRLAFEMAQLWPKWVSCMPHGSFSFWTAVKPAGWRTEASVTP